jgi:hypothetical protein
MTTSVCLKMDYANTRWLGHGDGDEMAVKKININTIL